MNTETNYKKRIAHYQRVQMSLCESLEISIQHFREIEFETGCRLIDEYFFECAYPELSRRYSTQLLEDRKHMYWPWFINQKQRVDEDYRKENIHTYLTPSLTDYKLELTGWCMYSKTHDRLREFINQSKTLHL